MKAIIEGGAFSKPVNVTDKDEIVLGGNRVVSIHSVCFPQDAHITRWAVLQIGEHVAYVVGGETLHRDLEDQGFAKQCDIYVSPRRAK